MITYVRTIAMLTTTTTTVEYLLHERTRYEQRADRSGVVVLLISETQNKLQKYKCSVCDDIKWNEK